MTNNRFKVTLCTLFILLSILACNSSVSEEPGVLITEVTHKASEEIITEKQTITPSIMYTLTPSPLGHATITANLCNFRSGPGTDFSIIRYGEKDDVLPVFGKNHDGTWLWVDWTQPLWISSSLVDLDVDISTIVAVNLEDLVFTGGELFPTDEVTITLPPKPTETQSPKLEAVYLLYKSTTELQFKEYMNYAYGEMINEKVVIGQVLDDGKVALSGKWSEYYFGSYDFCVIVENVPKNIALTYVKGHSINLEASIHRHVGNYRYYNDCKDTLILSYISSN